MRTECCIDGWLPGESGVERCEQCKRFNDDNEASEYLAAVLATVRRANSMEGPAEWELHATRNHPFNYTNDGAQWLEDRWQHSKEASTPTVHPMPEPGRLHSRLSPENLSEHSRHTDHPEARALAAEIAASLSQKTLDRMHDRDVLESVLLGTLLAFENQAAEGGEDAS